MRFENGDHVAHPYHGAGTITNVLQLAMGGKDRDYYCIDLVSGGTKLMVPIEEAEGIGLRPVVHDTKALYRTLEGPPTPLDDNYTVRQAEIADRLRSGDPLQWASALCDLTWRAREHDLTKKDTDLRSELLDLLTHEVALATQTTPEQAQHRMEAILANMANQEAQI